MAHGRAIRTRESRPQRTACPAPLLVPLADRDPHAVAIVAMTATRVAPAVVLTSTPAPAVAVDPQAEVGSVARATAHSPAIAARVADHSRRSALWRHRQETARDCRGTGNNQKGLAKSVHRELLGKNVRPPIDAFCSTDGPLIPYARDE